MGRRIAVRVVAWAMAPLKCGHSRLTEDEVREALIKAFPRRDVMWRTGVIRDAQARNRERMAAR